MKPHVHRSRETVEELKRKLSSAESSLRIEIEECKRDGHNWGQVETAHIYREGYTCPGDPPGTMGIDWRGPTYVPSETTNRWKRVCKDCGETQYTYQTDQHVTLTPKF